MGKYSDELARIVAAPNYTLDRDSAQLSVALGGLGRTLIDTASSPGFTGSAGEDASEMFVQQARRARINSDVHGGAARVFAAANEALDRARDQAGNIPVGQMGRSEFSAIVAGGWVLLGPFGASRVWLGRTLPTRCSISTASDMRAPLWWRFRPNSSGLRKAWSPGRLSCESRARHGRGISLSSLTTAKRPQ